MARDFRSEKMESYEGKGQARKAWDAYAAKVNSVVPPSWGLAVAEAARPAVDYVVRERMEDALGFWLLWHVYGGFDGLRDRRGMSRSTIYKKISRFRQMFGVHPDEFELPGITIDYEAYWRAAAETEEPGNGTAQ
jgi:hypothetical protein